MFWENFKCSKLLGKYFEIEAEGKPPINMIAIALGFVYK